MLQIVLSYIRQKLFKPMLIINSVHVDNCIIVIHILNFASTNIFVRYSI